MSKFPAKHLSAHDIGKRVKVVTTAGATITDRLTSIMAKEQGIGLDGRKTLLYVCFESVGHADRYGQGAFEVEPNSWVKRIDK